MTKREARLSKTTGPWIILVAAVAALSWGGPARADQTGEGPNACGCRRDSAGNCYCDRKSKCGCPGECEPKGCEEKRAKQLEKEVEIETKKAEAAARQHRTVDPDEGSPAAERPSRPSPEKPQPRVEHRMSAADKRTLEHLLEQYVAQHPEARQMTVDQILGSLAGGASKTH